MSRSKNNLSDDAILKEIETNLFELMGLLRYWQEVEVHSNTKMMWTITNYPSYLFNSILGARLSIDEIETNILTAIGHYKKNSLPFSWYVGPSTIPLNLGFYLEAHDFRLSETQVGMAINLHKLNKPKQTSQDLTIDLVDNEESLKIWHQVLKVGFDMSELAVEPFWGWFKSLGFGKKSLIYNFLGRVDNKPVATCTLFPGRNVAGIYCVSVIPEARRKGIGQKMVIHALSKAQSMGYQVGILQASEMGLSIYHQIGFQEYCQIYFYTFHMA